MNGITKINAVRGYQQIASGRKINRAADNAAGMAVANKLKANANGSNVASRNAQEGINVTRIADGGYDSIMERLQNVRELSIRAMNGTNSEDDKRIIQDEIDQQLSGVSESARNTVYNQTKLMDNAYATMDIASNPTGKGSKIQLESASLDALGLQGYSVTGSNASLDAIDRAIEKVSKDRSALGANANGLEARKRSNDIAYENMTAAQSRIEDTDIGKASSESKRDETLQKVQIAMLKKQMEQEAMITKIM